MELVKTKWALGVLLALMQLVGGLSASQAVATEAMPAATNVSPYEVARADEIARAEASRMPYGGGPMGQRWRPETETESGPLNRANDPATMILLGSGLLGIGVLRMRRQLPRETEGEPEAARKGGVLGF